MIDTNKELRKKIAVLLRKFSMDPHHSPLKKQKDREIVGRFIDRLHSTEFDTGGLPYHSKNGLAEHHNKSECVFALVCDVVLTYWRVVETPLATQGHVADTLKDKLKRLETVYNTYDQLKVLGDVKGYCLFKSQLPKPKKEIESESASEETGQEKIDEGTGSTTDQPEAQVNDGTPPYGAEMPKIPIDPPRTGNEHKEIA